MLKKKSLFFQKLQWQVPAQGESAPTAEADPFAKLFGGSLYNKTSICPLIDLRLCEHSIYLIYEKNV